MPKIKIKDSATLKRAMRIVKDTDEAVAAKNLLKMILKNKVDDSSNKTKFTEEERKKLAKEGLALPDGSFPIRNKQDLKDAIKAIGLSRDYDTTKKWIIKRARALNAVDLLPESWKIKDSSDDEFATDENVKRLADLLADGIERKFKVDVDVKNGPRPVVIFKDDYGDTFSCELSVRGNEVWHTVEIQPLDKVVASGGMENINNLPLSEVNSEEVHEIRDGNGNKATDSKDVSVNY